MKEARLHKVPCFCCSWLLLDTTNTYLLLEGPLSGQSTQLWYSMSFFFHELRRSQKDGFDMAFNDGFLSWLRFGLFPSLPAHLRDCTLYAWSPLYSIFGHRNVLDFKNSPNVATGPVHRSACSASRICWPHGNLHDIGQDYQISFVVQRSPQTLSHKRRELKMSIVSLVIRGLYCFCSHDELHRLCRRQRWKFACDTES